MEWGTVPLDEQETVINIDYCEKTINIYTSRKSVGKRLEKKLGEADKIIKLKDEIVAVEYKRNLSDKNIRPILSMSTIIGGFRNSKENDEIEFEDEEIEVDEETE